MLTEGKTKGGNGIVKEQTDTRKPMAPPPMMKFGYYYLHTNGRLIHKPLTVVETDPEYFDSSFVQKIWKIDSMEQYIAMVVEIESPGFFLKD